MSAHGEASVLASIEQHFARATAAASGREPNRDDVRTANTLIDTLAVLSTAEQVGLVTGLLGWIPAQAIDGADAYRPRPACRICGPYRQAKEDT